MTEHGDPPPGTLGDRYQVVSRLGTGGMGVVYKAIDVRLNRSVAIKVIHGGRLAGGRDRLRAEALAAASLDHPYICKVYELIEAGDESFLVMEFVDGDTLAAMLRSGPLPLIRTLRIVSQILQGLAAAHARGLVHRDVKPANVIVTNDGHVKLLDFGLARADAVSTPAEVTHTTPGERHDNAGTPHYMAPEQAIGRPVTARSDLFAVGVLFYECVSGRLPFTGASGYDYVRHMLSDEPRPLERVAPHVPADVARLIHRCLEKTPADRPQSAVEVLAEVDRVTAAVSHPGIDVPTAGDLRRRRLFFLTAATALIVVLAAALAGWLWPPPPSLHLASGRQWPLVSWPGAKSDSRVSPDGRWVAFLSRRGGIGRAYVQAIDGTDATPVALPTGLPQSLAWSPDGRELAVVVYQPPDTVVLVVPAFFGGPPRISVTLDPALRDVQLLRWIERAMYVQAATAAGRALHRLDIDRSTVGSISAGWPVNGRLRDFDVSPDGRRVAYTAVTGDQTDLWVANLDGSAARPLTDDASFERHPAWTASGHTIVFQSNRGGQINLWEISLDGALTALTSGQAEDRPGGMSADGALLSFTRRSDDAQLWLWTPGEQGGRALGAGALGDFAPTVSSDGATLVFQRGRPTQAHGSMILDSALLSARLGSNNLTEPSQVGVGFAATLSPDGSWLAYLHRKPGASGMSISVKHLASGRVHLVSESGPLPAFSPFPLDWAEQKLAWSALGEALFFVEESTTRALRRYRLGSDASDPPLDTAGSREVIRELYPSTDGQLLAYLFHAARTSTLRVADLRSGETRDVATLEGSPVSVFGRGWLEDNRTFVLVQRRELHQDQSSDLDVLLVPMDGDRRTAGVIDHAYVATARLDPRTSRLYVTRAEAGTICSDSRWPPASSRRSRRTPSKARRSRVWRSTGRDVSSACTAGTCRTSGSSTQGPSWIRPEDRTAESTPGRQAARQARGEVLMARKPTCPEDKAEAVWLLRWHIVTIEQVCR